MTNIVALVGSLREGSTNRRITEAAADAAPEGVSVTVYDGIGELPFYNEDVDVEGTVPAAAAALRDAVGSADALLLVTPEYNGTLPAVLKNAIDWLSRPFGAGALKDRTVGVIASSPSANGARWALADVVKSVGIAGGAVADTATLSIGATGDKFGDRHPRDNADVVAEIVDVLSVLSQEPALTR